MINVLGSKLRSMAYEYIYLAMINVYLNIKGPIKLFACLSESLTLEE